MKQILVVILLILNNNSFGQNCNRDTICQLDTILIQPHLQKVNAKNKSDSNFVYKFFKCSKISNLGIRVDIGISKYYYNPPTKAWLGNHNGLSIGLILAIKHFNIGFRFKPWTVNPNQNLVFNSDTLSKLAKLNPVKLDYFLGYSFNFKYNISIEPYIGYSRTVFAVINENDLKTKFTIPAANGFITGLSLNKYFKLKNAKYIGLFANLGYSSVNYKTTHKSLGNGYTEWTLGISYKGFIEKEFFKRLN